MIQGRHDKGRWLDRLVLLGLVIVLFFVAQATWSLYQKNKMAQDNLGSSIDRLTKLTDRKNILQDKIAKLNTPRGIEEEIRANLPVVKAGEQVINIVEPEAVATATATTTKPWWQIW